MTSSTLRMFLSDVQIHVYTCPSEKIASKTFLQDTSNSLVVLGVPLFQLEYCYHIINEPVSSILNEE